MKIPERMDPAQEREERPPRRKKSKKWVIPVLLVLALTLRIATLPRGGLPEDGVTVHEQVYSGVAEAGTISAALTGAGTLAPARTGEVTIPDSLEVETYHVQNGDTVHRGDVLASVKPTAVASAILELQQVLQELDGDIREQSGQSADSYITASAAGRVKAIYAQEGESVTDAMSRYGALMVLSLDGRMKVTLSDLPLQVGQAVEVRLEDGTAAQGRVDSVRQGTAVITVSDEKAGLGEQVQVYDGEGALLGSGSLEISSPLNIVGYYGTVDRISVSLGQKVSSGGVLFQLTDTGSTQTYEDLLELRQKLQDRMAELYALYPDGKLLAPEDGVVSGIPEDGSYEPLETGKEGVSSLAAQGTWKIVLLSQVEEGEPPADPPVEPEPTESEPTEPTPPEPTEPEPTEPEEPAVHTGYVAKITGFDEATGMVSYLRSAQTVDVLEIGDAASLAGSLVLSQPGQIPYTAIAGASPENLTEGALLFLEGESATLLSSGGAGRPENPGLGGLGGLIAGMQGGMGSGGGQSVPQTPSYETYSLETAAVLTLAAQDRMSVEIPVDELDVLCLEKGTQATVTLDALKGETYTGTVTRIDRTGTNSGGSAKFTVEITLPGDERMLSGMSASVSIDTGLTQAAVTVPAAALQESGNTTYVYTGYSGKDDTLSDPVEVTTGASNADTVQILSGLEAGQTYYYRYADSITYQFG